MSDAISFPLDTSGVLDARLLTHSIDGYGATLAPGTEASPDLTTDEYANEQLHWNTRKTLEFLLPIIERCKARSVVDIGCGVGTMVTTLLERGYDANGVDVSGLSQRWSRLGLPQQRFVIVDPVQMKLPFPDGRVDFVFSLGVIEHVGTSNGHSDRLPDYKERRSEWLREIFRTVKVGGHLLVGGPNRNFPIDVAHGLDSRATPLERSLSRMAGVSVHKTWTENFLWGYGDLDEYLSGLAYEVEPLNVSSYVHYSRVPALLRPIVETYVKRMPRRMLGTGFNPWMMALIRKTA